MSEDLKLFRVMLGERCTCFCCMVRSSMDVKISGLKVHPF